MRSGTMRKIADVRASLCRSAPSILTRRLDDRPRLQSAGAARRGPRQLPAPAGYGRATRSWAGPSRRSPPEDGRWAHAIAPARASRTSGAYEPDWRKRRWGHAVGNAQDEIGEVSGDRVTVQNVATDNPSSNQGVDHPVNRHAGGLNDRRHPLERRHRLGRRAHDLANEQRDLVGRRAGQCRRDLLQGLSRK